MRLSLNTDGRTHMNSKQKWATFTPQLAVCCAAVSPFWSAPTVRADERRFTYVYEATTVPKGDLEFEQWFSWQRPTREDHDFDRLEFRHELEYGLTDRLQVSLYLA